MGIDKWTSSDSEHNRIVAGRRPFGGYRRGLTLLFNFRSFIEEALITSSSSPCITLYLIMQHACETSCSHHSGSSLQSCILAKNNISNNSWACPSGSATANPPTHGHMEVVIHQDNRNSLTFKLSFSVLSPPPPPSTKKHYKEPKQDNLG